MSNPLSNINPDDITKAGEIIKQTAGYLKLADLVRTVLGERAAQFLFRKKTLLEVDRAKQLMEVELSKNFLDKSLDKFASTEEGQRTMVAIGASFAHQQLRRYTNLESVMDTALGQLEQQETTISEEPVDEDWMIRFINYAGDTSNEEIQKLWGRILAGEIAKPHSYSIRTLDFLKSTSRMEAEIITDMAKACLCMNNSAFLPGKISDYTLANQTELVYSDLIQLGNLGLIHLDNIAQNLTVTHTNNETYITFFYGRYVIYFDVITDLYSIRIPAISLSQIANELRQLIDIEINKDLLKRIKALIRDQIGDKHPITCKFVDTGKLHTESFSRGQTVIISLRLSKNEQ